MGRRSEFVGREGPKCSSPFVRPCNTLVVHSTPSQVWSGSPATQNFRRDATGSQGELGRCEGWNALSPCLQAPGRCQDPFFDDPTVGMRYSGGEAEVTGDDIRRFAAKFDPPPKILLQRVRRFGLANRSDRNATGSRAPVFRTAFVAGARRRRTALVGSRAPRGPPGSKAR
jgi:hypothetical protein